MENVKDSYGKDLLESLLLSLMFLVSPYELNILIFYPITDLEINIAIAFRFQRYI